MKLTALLLTFCFSINVMASTGTVQELERHLDEYQYALTVEWDQKDQSFYRAQTKIFFDQISHAINEQGLGKEEILSLIESKKTDKVAVEALKLKLNLMGKVGSSAELISVLQDNASDFYMRGASWTGNYELWGYGLALVAVLGYIIWFGQNHECVAWSEKWECSSTSSTDDYGTVTTDTDCGWVDYCTEYERK